MPEPPFLPAYYHNRTSFFWYIRKFINECPSGLMTLHEFQRHFCDGTVGQESAEYAKQIFRTLDSNRVRKWLPLTLGPVNVSRWKVSKLNSGQWVWKKLFFLRMGWLISGSLSWPSPCSSKVQQWRSCAGHLSFMTRTKMEPLPGKKCWRSCRYVWAFCCINKVNM